MGMGDKNMSHGAGADRLQQRRDVPGLVGAGIDHDHIFLVADEIDAGAAKGEGTGIGREHSLDARR